MALKDGMLVSPPQYGPSDAPRTETGTYNVIAGSEQDVHRRLRLAAGFGLLYGSIGLLIVVPMVMIFGWMWGLYPHSVGLEVRIALPATLIADVEGRLMLTVQCPNSDTPSSNDPELRLNSRLVSTDDLRGALRAELSRRAHRVVYVQGEGCLKVEDVVRVIDIARDAWYGVPVVLMTPELEKSLHLPQR